ncbi:MAG: maleylpyruvate isomerase N-terminal domain-containing protein [bacterium]|nr:maleylpyruvate isomerase N-terminal domain-containing protein [bacterium]
MTRDEFTQAFEADFDPLISLLQSLTPAQAAQPFAEGQWSLRDLAAHLLFRDTIVIRALEALMRGEAFDWTAYSDRDADNAEAVRRHRNTPLKRFVSEWRITHFALMESLARVPDEKLLDDGKIPQWLLVAVTEHYRHHTEQAQAWVERMKREGGFESGGGLTVLR